MSDDTEVKQDSTTTEQQTTQEESKPQETKEAPKEASAPLSKENAAKLKRQIEFYFSNSNFPRDKFLLQQSKSNKDGWIPLQVLTTFNRVKSITEDVDQIQQAIGESEVVVLNEDRTQIKRKHPVPENLNTDQRTAHVRGLGRDWSLEELQQLFSKYGEVRAVRVMRSKKDKEPTGSAFVEFASEDDLEKLLKEEKIEHKGADIKAQSKEAFSKSQKESLLAKRSAPESVSEPTFTEGLLVQFKNVPTEGDIYPAKLKEFFRTVAQVAYVEFDKGETEGIARCESAEEAKKLKESDKPFEGATLSYEILSGGDEKMFYVRAENNRSRGGNRGGKRGRGKQRRH